VFILSNCVFFENNFFRDPIALACSLSLSTPLKYSTLSVIVFSSPVLFSQSSISSLTPAEIACEKSFPALSNNCDLNGFVLRNQATNFSSVKLLASHFFTDFSSSFSAFAFSFRKKASHTFPHNFSYQGYHPLYFLESFALRLHVFLTI